ALRAGVLDPPDLARRSGTRAPGESQSRQCGSARRAARRDSGGRGGQRAFLQRVRHAHAAAGRRADRGPGRARRDRRAAGLAASASSGARRLHRRRQHRDQQRRGPSGLRRGACRLPCDEAEERAWAMNMQGRPTRPETAAAQAGGTFTGNRALDMEEALIFESGRFDATGVDIEAPAPFQPRLGPHARESALELPGLAEPEAIRHYVRLSRNNYSIDAGIYPLGSCTMKHNPRLNEKMARLPGFADVHPLQPVSTAQGALELIEALSQALMTMTGMAAIAMSPKAGAHGELCGMMAIKAAIEARGEGETRRVVLVPDSAHGTNPATAALIGYSVRSIPAGEDGIVSAEAVRAALAPDVAAIMLTNPNTCGLFEREIVGIAEAVREAGAYFYCDGANFNAIVGKTRPGDLGVDAMHINLHKTFSTPHGGGGPGAGPVALSARLAPYAPVPFVKREGGALCLIEHAEGRESFGRITAFHGQMGMFVRALSFILSHGADGLKQASEDAVLSANYIRASL